jgi:uncharacterized repeat protein (TIGR03803 family)
VGGLVADSDGNLYGTTQHGGINDSGTVFKIAAATHDLTTLVKFDGFNGYEPNASLLLGKDNSLFGTTNGGETVFKVDIATNSLSVLARFNGSNGSQPQSSLVADANGNLYGTTYEGGGDQSLGTVFMVDTVSNTITTLVSFDDTNGANPSAGITIGPDGNLYGTTSGNFGQQSRFGTLFELSPVPEPSSLALAVIAALLFLAFRIIRGFRFRIVIFETEHRQSSLLDPNPPCALPPSHYPLSSL